MARIKICWKCQADAKNIYHNPHTRWFTLSHMIHLSPKILDRSCLCGTGNMCFMICVAPDSLFYSIATTVVGDAMHFSVAAIKMRRWHEATAINNFLLQLLKWQTGTVTSPLISCDDSRREQSRLKWIVKNANRWSVYMCTMHSRGVVLHVSASETMNENSCTCSRLMTALFIRWRCAWRCYTNSSFVCAHCERISCFNIDFFAGNTIMQMF